MTLCRRLIPHGLTKLPGTLGFFLLTFAASLSHSTAAPAQELEYLVENHDGFAYTVVDDGDVDGDAFPDILVALPESDKAAKKAGAVYLFLGKNVGDDLILDLRQADYEFLGEYENHRAGSLVAFLFDEDGDGCDEIEISFGEDTLTDVVTSSELPQFAASPSARFVTIYGSVGASHDVDCSLNPKGRPAAFPASAMLMIGVLFTLWGIGRFSRRA